MKLNPGALRDVAAARAGGRVPGWAGSTSSEAAESPAAGSAVPWCPQQLVVRWAASAGSWPSGKAFTHCPERLAPSHCSPEWINPSP